MRTVHLLAVVVLAGCSDRPVLTVDGPTRADRPPPSDSQRSDAGRVDQRLPPAPDRSSPDRRTPSTHHYLLWQAPQGFTGMGPAIEIIEEAGGAQLHAAASVSAVQPHAKNLWWSKQVTLAAGDAATLFKLLDAVDYTKLPHKLDTPGECYPQFYCEGCAAGTVDFHYWGPVDLTPEMNAVLAFMDGNIKLSLPPEIPSPLHFCPWGASTPCGPAACQAAMQICVETLGQGGTGYSCKPVPAGCEASSSRSCACAGKALCTSPFDLCQQSSTTTNVLRCECPNC